MEKAVRRATLAATRGAAVTRAKDGHPISCSSRQADELTENVSRPGGERVPWSNAGYWNAQAPGEFEGFNARFAEQLSLWVGCEEEVVCAP